ncbi:glycosyltransferase [Alteribacter aurantiacus]|uniref:glycosyltransferase n=1 Tax=Alteribacter aurantiacus TaxID=254410 RepID=UPI00040C6502|nr:glycosyltransferase family A protein [Alteribacter aurantiacus]
MITIIFSSIVLLIVGTICIQWYKGIRNMPFITQKATDSLSPNETVSVIIAAKDEEKDLASTIRSLMNQSYSNMEVIVVNDRSVDGTGRLLDQLSSAFPSLHMIHIKELPTGWLGKNHALYKGYKASSGQWLLFADADITFHERAVERSISYAKAANLDHLALLPENKGGSFFYRMFYIFWSIIGVWNFIAAGHAGVGAFNFMKREVYKKAGTHKAIALRPDDDMKLGKTIVDGGFNQKLGFGNGVISIQWYDTLREMVRGLEKNLFAFMQYRISIVIAATLGILSFHVSPFFLVFYPSFWVSTLSAYVLLIYVFMYVKNKRYFSHPWWLVVTVPLCALIFLYCLWRSMWKTYRRGGVEWRGTTYGLDELKGRKRE